MMAFSPLRVSWQKTTCSWRTGPPLLPAPGDGPPGPLLPRAWVANTLVTVVTASPARVGPAGWVIPLRRARGMRPALA